MTTSLEIEQLGAALGAKVHGVDLRAPVTPDLAEALRAALAKHQVLVLQGQHDMTAQQQIDGAAIFGYPGSSEPWRSFALLDGGVSDPATVQARSAQVRPYTDRWHSDMSFCPRPPVAGVLYAMVVPKVGGDTAFVSTAAIWDSLSDRLKQLCEGLQGFHTMWFPAAGVTGSPDGYVAGNPPDFIARTRRLLPGELHPLVKVHPDTGRKYLYIGADKTWLDHLEGIPDGEANMLLAYLRRQLDNIEFQFRWHWTPGDLVIWDERPTNHMGMADHWDLDPTRVVRSVWSWPDNDPVRIV